MLCVHVRVISNQTKFFVLKFGDNYPSSNRDTVQNVILQGPDFTYEYTRTLTVRKHACKVSLKSYFQFFQYGIAIVDQKVAGGKKKEYRGETL